MDARVLAIALRGAADALDRMGEENFRREVTAHPATVTGTTAPPQQQNTAAPPSPPSPPQQQQQQQPQGNVSSMISLETLSQQFRAYADAVGVPAALEVLSRYGVKRLSEAPQDTWPAISRQITGTAA